MNFTEEQALSINKRNSNILVSASAGSGKTAVLVERVISRVLKDRIDIDKILVVTFTNAAAAELKERLMLAIYENLKQNPKDRFLKRQLSIINRASITTIHSFCLKLIRSNFDILDLDPNFKICDETESNILKVKAINKVLENEYIKTKEDSNTKKRLYDLLELFGSKDENLIKYILKIYSYIQSFAYPKYWLEEKIEKYNVGDISNLYDLDFGKTIYEDTMSNLEVVISKGEEILNTIQQNEEFQKYYDALDKEMYMIKQVVNNNNNDWDMLYTNLVNVSFSTFPQYRGDNITLKEKVTNYRNNVLKKQVEVCKKSVYAPTQKIVQDLEVAYKYVKYIYEFLIQFEKEFEKLKQEKSYIDFNDIEHLSLKLLLEPNEDGKYTKTDIAKSFSEKFEEVYTDEYQDISFIQEAILNAVSKNNNRFMVGDIKQSIYKFRQAMPDIFNEKYDTYNEVKDINDKQNSKIILAKNFRSRDEVLSSINYIFERIMSKEFGDCDYSDIETLKYGATLYDEVKKEDTTFYKSQNYKTELNVINLNKDIKSNANLSYKKDGEEENDNVVDLLDDIKNFEIEANYIAQKINEIVNKKYTYNVKTKEFKKAEYKDIVILLRSIKGKSTILEETLKKYNIPVFCDVSSNLFESEEVMLTLSLLQVIDNPYQDIALVSVLYSIIGRVTLDELVYIRSVDKHSRIYNNLLEVEDILSTRKKENNNLTDMEISVFNKIDRFLKLIFDLKEYSKTSTISQLLVRIYDETNIYRQYIFDNNENQRRANLDMMINVAKVCERQNVLSLSEYVKYVDNIKEKSDNSMSTAKIIGENENVVRIMTIHKSKGLEFPYCILCDTTKKYNMMDINDTLTLHHKLGIGINVVNEDLKVTYPSCIKQAIKNVAKLETKAEELRMLYVAMTRAKEKLYIYATIDNLDKFNDKLLVSYSSDKKIDISLLANNNSYFENIYMSILNEDKTISKDAKELFDINVITLDKDFDLNLDDDNNQLKLSAQDMINELKTQYQNSINDLKKQADNERIESVKKDVQEIEKKVKNVIDNLDFKYKYIEDTKTKQRISVSELKKQYLDENVFIERFDKDLNDKNIQEIFDKYPKPNFMLEEKDMYTQARKGTLIHFILENLDMKKDYTKTSLKDEIDLFVKKGIINKNDRKFVSVNKILTFLNSSLGKQIKSAIVVKKEQEFTLKDERISKSIIQGIIDLYFINKDNEVVLIDFKTDRLDEDKDYILRYKKQLDIYKVALEKLLKLPVNEVCIYSFYKDKEIKVN